MIAFLQGKLIEVSENHLTIGVGDAESLVGYRVSVPASYASSGRHERGNKATFYVYTHVREDQLDLYGFETISERELFVSLMKCNGVGPKAALAILSGASADVIVDAVIEGRAAALTAIPGVGKKTAERLTLELRDEFIKKRDAGIFYAPASIAASNDRSAFPVFEEARQALTSLGFKSADIEAVLKKTKTFDRVESVVRSALRELGPS